MYSLLLESVHVPACFTYLLTPILICLTDLVSACLHMLAVLGLSKDFHRIVSGMMPHHLNRPVCLKLLSCFHLFGFCSSCLNSACFVAAETSPSLLLSDPKTATTITKILEVQLQDSTMDAAGVTKASKGDKLEGQLVEVKFPAKKAGKYNLQLMCMSGGLMQSCGVCEELVLQADNQVAKLMHCIAGCAV